MDERQPSPDSNNRPKIWPERLADWQVLLLLLLIALVLRVSIVTMTEVPARDSVGFIRYALQLEHSNWHDVIDKQHQHPGYSLTVLLASVPIRYFAGTTDCYTMQYSAQLASSIAGLLLVIPMFYLGKNLFSRSVGFWGALVFQCLPCSGQLLSDAVSDPLYLLFLSTSLLWGVLAIKQPSARRFAACGFFCGLTYLVRPEGVLVLAATGMVIPMMQLLPRWRTTWKKAMTYGGALLVGGIIAGSPYFAITGSFSNKPSFRKMTDRITGLVADASNSRPKDIANGPVFASIFGVHISTEGTLREKMTRGGRAVCAEFAQAYLYVVWAPVLIGLCWYARRYANMPEAWMLFIYFFLHGGAVWWLTVNAGYVSDRHILPLVIVTMFQAVAAMIEYPFRVKIWLERSRLAQRIERLARPAFANPTAWSISIVMILIVVGLTKTLQPMHAHRAGHHAAGVWLAKHSKPGDWIDDDHAWAHFYSGRFMNEFAKDTVPPGPRIRFVVYSVPKDPNHLPVGRRYSEASILKEGGEIVYHWPENLNSSKAKLRVYRIAQK